MDLLQEQIRQQFQDFSGKHGPVIIEQGTVTAVNDDDTIAIELSSGATDDEVRLKSVVKDGGKVILVPLVGSVVLVGLIGNSKQRVVLVVDEISEVLYIIDGVTFSSNSAGFLLQNGDDTLKDAITLIIEAVQKIAIVYGENPDFIKLQQAQVKINNILR